MVSVHPYRQGCDWSTLAGAIPLLLVKGTTGSEHHTQARYVTLHTTYIPQAPLGHPS